MKKTVSILLLLTMLFALSCGGAYADDTGAAGRSADVVILYTSDIHCGIDQGFGYAGLMGIRDYLIKAGNDVILVDNGDNIQGEPVGTMTKGEIPLDLMNEMGYDIAIPGNHEFDYGMDQFLALAEKAKFEYISCNFNHEGELVFKPYVIRELGGTKVAFVGVTTPETLASSMPKHFQDENGNYIYGFLEDETGRGVYEAVQKAVDDARAEGAEYVIVLGHLSLNEACRPWTYANVIENTSGFEALLDGHSHDTEQIVMKNRDGAEVIRSACGTKMACVGWCRIAKDGTVSCGLYTWENEASAPAMLGLENKMSRAVDNAMKALNRRLEEVVAKTAVDLTICDPAAVDLNGRPIRMVRRAETNLGDLCADAYRIQSGADIGFINGGGVRTDIKAGDITLQDILKVNPFGNELCVIEVSGQQILDALEWGAHGIPGENGGFVQVSGLSYEIHSYISSPCKMDEKSSCIGFEGERRVRNVLVDGKPVDPAGTYTLAGHNFMLLEKGDGFAMFDGAKVLQNCVKLDNQVLIDYIVEDLGGVIGEEYEDLTGQGRIVIFDEKP